MIKVYCNRLTPRITYIFDFIFTELFDEPVTLTTDELVFSEGTSPKLNYSDRFFPGPAFNIKPTSLLFESTIKSIEPDVIHFGSSKALFATVGDFPFDVFAASFYLLSRYEEYLPHKKDQYGRYLHTNSIAWRENVLDQPLVDQWVVALKNALSEKFPELVFRRKQFKCNLTYDIDIAYAYLHKGWLKNLVGFARSLVSANWNQLTERWQVLFEKKQDPFDCFEWLDALHLYCRLKPTYFFLVAKKRLGYDRNISTNVKEFRSLIEYYSTIYEVGIHPSWQSGDNKNLLKEEIQWLEVITERSIRSGRQHYLRFSLPETFRSLVDVGILHEYSMGYGSVNGFRASVCTPFKWYDLENEQETDLTIHPFCFMDSTSFYQLQQNSRQAYEELSKYYELVKKLNGSMIMIWHNHLLSTSSEFREWRAMFELFMKEIVYWDAYSDPTTA